MIAAIAWDQTLLDLALALGVGVVVYRLAARELRRQETARELRQRRDAIEQVLSMLDGPAGEYLADPSLDYPQREMVELERRALQAQLLFWRDLEIQKSLRDVSYPERHRDAAERLRGIAGDVDRQMSGS
jgi:hypothetical protein